MESLEEFERIEQEMKDIEFILTGEIPRSPDGSKQLEDAELLLFDPSKSIDDTKQFSNVEPDVLKEFEDLEAACEEILLIKMKATEQEKMLSQKENNDSLKKIETKENEANKTLKRNENND